MDNKHILFKDKIDIEKVYEFKVFFKSFEIIFFSHFFFDSESGYDFALFLFKKFS